MSLRTALIELTRINAMLEYSVYVGYRNIRRALRAVRAYVGHKVICDFFEFLGASDLPLGIGHSRSGLACPLAPDKKYIDFSYLSYLKKYVNITILLALKRYIGQASNPEMAFSCL